MDSLEQITDEAGDSLLQIAYLAWLALLVAVPVKLILWMFS